MEATVERFAGEGGTLGEPMGLGRPSNREKADDDTHREGGRPAAANPGERRLGNVPALVRDR